MLVSYHTTTQRLNPEDLDMNHHRRENLKARIKIGKSKRSLHAGRDGWEHQTGRM